jgi:hypothetical protein
MPTSFVTRVFDLPHKNWIFYFITAKRGKMGVFCEVATQEIVQNNTTPIFTARGPCRKAISEVLGIFSTCNHILNYFWAKSI